MRISFRHASSVTTHSMTRSLLQKIGQRLLETRSSSPSVSTHLRRVNRNISSSPSPEPVLQHRLAIIIVNRTPPSPSVAEMFPLEPPSPPFHQTPPLYCSSPTPPSTQIHCFFILDYSYTTTVIPSPSETEREYNQLPEAKQEMQHLPTASECTEITWLGVKCTRYCAGTRTNGIH